MKITFVGLIIISVFAGCQKRPPIQIGDMVEYSIEGVTGTGRVVAVEDTIEGHKVIGYYKLEEENESGQKYYTLFHPKLIKPLEQSGKRDSSPQKNGVEK